MIENKSYIYVAGSKFESEGTPDEHMTNVYIAERAANLASSGKFGAARALARTAPDATIETGIEDIIGRRMTKEILSSSTNVNTDR